MTLLERLQAHRGGLLRVKSELYWYGGFRGWDGNPGRICLLLDAAADGGAAADADSASVGLGRRGQHRAAAHLLIDGAPRWVWMAEADVEVIDGSR